MEGILSLEAIQSMDKMLYLRYLVEAANLFTACICAMLPARKDLRFGAVKTWVIALVLTAGLIVVGSYICLQYGWETNHFFLPASVVLAVIYCIMVGLSFPKKLFCLLNAAMLVAFSVFYASILAAPLEAGNTDLVFTLRGGVIALGFSWVVAAFFSRTLATKIPDLMHNKQFNGMWVLLLFIPLILCGLFFMGNRSGNEEMISKEARPSMLGLLLVFPIAVWVIYHLLWGTATRITENARLKSENMLLRMEQKRYYELRTYVGDTRTMRHDYRQHVHVLQSLANDGKIDEIREYLKNFSDESAQNMTFFTGNDTLDAILSHYDHKAKEQQTSVTWKIALPKELPVNETEFCAMIGNLLENALNATINLPPEQRKIRVMSEMVTESLIGFSMDNTFAGKLRLDKDGIPRSTRPGHGLGLQSVGNTVRRYHGTINYQIHENVFSVNILMYGKTAPKQA